MQSFIVTLEEFFKMNRETQDLSNFDQDKRQLVIPLYQRPYLWEDEKISTLLEDIANQSKFLGLIILDEDQSYYEIIDGQQRVTTCLLLLSNLFNLLKGKRQVQFSLASLLFPDSNLILKNNSLCIYVTTSSGKLVLKNPTESDYLAHDGSIIRLSINKLNDIYYQSSDFYRADLLIRKMLFKKCQTLSDNKETPTDIDLTDPDNIDTSSISYQKISEIKNKLLKSEFLVLIKERRDRNQSAEQIFLDINEKSKELSPADIFKGHCFANYQPEFHTDLKKQWSKLMKQSVEFMAFNSRGTNTGRDKNKNLSNYIYKYLLIAHDSSIFENLSYPNGKHILDGLDGTATENMLSDMISFGETIISFNDNLKQEDYFFENLCNDCLRHKNETTTFKTLRILCQDILTSTSRANYQKLSFMYFIFELSRKKDLQTSMKFEDFRLIITNLYIYASLFAYDTFKKDKERLDRTLRDELKKECVKIENLRDKAKDLRISRLKLFTIPDNFADYPKQAFIYSIMDSYIPSKNFISHKYHINDAEKHNQEHFIIPKTTKHGIDWWIKDVTVKSKAGKESIRKITYTLNFDDDVKSGDKTLLDESTAKKLKKKTIDYIILPHDLNESLESCDIVYKISKIKDWYNVPGRNLPRHISIFIKHIEQLDSYQILLSYKNSIPAPILDCTATPADKDEYKTTIKKVYFEFLNDYFDEKCKSRPRRPLCTAI